MLEDKHVRRLLGFRSDTQPRWHSVLDDVAARGRKDKLAGYALSKFGTIALRVFYVRQGCLSIVGRRIANGCSKPSPLLENEGNGAATT